MAFELPEDECVRMTRDEMSATRMILIAASEMNYAKDDLKKRLATIPNGTERMTELTDGITDLFKDVMGTITDKQRRVLRNSAQDYEVHIVPKMMQEKSFIAVDKEDMTTLVNCAREKCKYCSMAGSDIRKCDLYNLLEAYVPLNDYGSDDIMCPYAYQEWIR